MRSRNLTQKIQTQDDVRCWRSQRKVEGFPGALWSNCPIFMTQGSTCPNRVSLLLNSDIRRTSGKILSRESSQPRWIPHWRTRIIRPLNVPVIHIDETSARTIQARKLVAQHPGPSSVIVTQHKTSSILLCAVHQTCSQVIPRYKCCIRQLPPLYRTEGI